MISADRNNEFPIIKRGYDPETVDAHVRELVERLEQATKQAGALESQLDEAKKREEAIHLTFVAATKTKDELIETARRELDEARASAKEEAERILSDAQYEAFRLVTEAREEAETTLAEARNEAHVAMSSARQEADSLVSHAQEEGQHLEKQHRSMLETARAEAAAEYEELIERIGQLREATADLEKRLSSYARGALDEITDLHRETTTHHEEVLAAGTALDASPAIEPTSNDYAVPAEVIQSKEEESEGTTLNGPITEHEEADPVLEPEEVAEVPAATEAEESAGEFGGPLRGSFYSRRSARLPRIGADAASGALDLVSAMRGHIRESDESEEGETEKSDDFAQQTA